MSPMPDDPRPAWREALSSLRVWALASQLGGRPSLEGKADGDHDAVEAHIQAITEENEALRLSLEVEEHVPSPVETLVVEMAAHAKTKAENERLRGELTECAKGYERTCATISEMAEELEETCTQRVDQDRKIRAFYDVLKHGDEKHQRWLRDMVDEHFGLKGNR